MKIIAIVAFVFTINTCLSQTYPYLFPSVIDSIYKAEDDEQAAGVRYSRIGNYKLALENFSLVWKIRNKTVLSQGAIDSFAAYHPVLADSFILAEAKKHRIIIINEEHHNPMHRVFVEHLLPELRKEGFDMMGIEAISDSMAQVLDKRGYTFVPKWGYPGEPCFSNMIRKAHDLKFKMFEYDGSGEQREVIEADNIIKMLNRYPDSKFIIYCGYDHLIKDTMPGQDSWHHAMAGWLRLKTGIDPLTIDQVPLTEAGVDSIDNPYRKLMHNNSSVVMIDGNGISLKPKSKYNADISVYHPDTKYFHGRPLWQITNDKEAKAINDKISISFPCLAFVYRSGEIRPMLFLSM